MQETRELAYNNKKFVLFGTRNDPYFENVVLGDPADPFFSLALARLARDATVFDIGANIGATVIAAAQAAGRVFAFEPQASTFSCLKKTVEANRLSNVSIFDLALGANEGEAIFFTNLNSGSASHLVTSDTLDRRSETKVRMTTLDRFVAEHEIARIDLIKIDVEGFEIDVLEGAKRTLETLKPAVIVEFNAFTMIGFRDMNPRRMLEFLRDTFPYLYRWQSKPVRISDDGSALSFIHDNLVSAGCVDDLYGAFSEL